MVLAYLICLKIVLQTAITQILNGKRWPHLNKCINPVTKTRLTKDIKEQIIAMKKNGMSQSKISSLLNVSQASVSRTCEKIQCQILIK